jgi:Ca2+-binding EF-hand superfamily protein
MPILSLAAHLTTSVPALPIRSTCIYLAFTRVHNSNTDPEEDIRAVIHVFDEDETIIIGVQELKAVMESLGTYLRDVYPD